MKKLLFVFMVLLMFSNCKEKSNGDLPICHIGSSIYRPSFLWTNADTTFINKTIKLDFNEAAKKWNSSSTLCLVDENKKPLDMKFYDVRIDHIKLDKPLFEVTSEKSEISFDIRCYPETESGIKSGYIILKPYALDRINDTKVTDGLEIEVFKWQFDFKHLMNPLAKILMWIALCVLALLFLWFVFLRPVIYPRFSNIYKIIVIPDQAPMQIKFKDYINVVLTDKRQKQSIWDRCMKGKILYAVNPVFQDPITFIPRKGKQIMAKYNSMKYMVAPNPIQQIGAATITVLGNNNIIITIN